MRRSDSSLAKQSQPRAPMSTRSLFVGLLFLGGLTLGSFVSLWLWNHSGSVWASLHSIFPSTSVSLGKTKSTRLDVNTCKKLDDSELRGAFRELDCLITLRRAYPKAGKIFNAIIIRKFRVLQRRLQEESVDWRTVSRWKYLYQLGTRFYPIRNKWAKSAKLPIYEVNGHHMSVPFWIKESFRRKLGPLFHFDTHNDMRAVPTPKDILQAVKNLKRKKDVKDSWHTIAHSIYDCAMPVAGGILTSGFRRVVWGKPDWNGYPEFVNRPFFFARPLKGIPVGVLPDKLTNSEKKKLVKRFKGLQGKRKNFRLYYDAKADPKTEVENAEAWIKVQKKQRPVKKKFEMITPFRLSILTTDKALNARGKGKGTKMFQRLLKAIPRGVFTLDLDLDYFASVDSAEKFKREAGSDPSWDLDVFKSKRKLLRKRLRYFRNLLIALRDNGRVPALITIADSTYLTFALDAIGEGQSEYTPIEHVAFLRRESRKIFREVYGRKVIGQEHEEEVLSPKTSSSVSVGSRTLVRQAIEKARLKGRGPAGQDRLKKPNTDHGKSPKSKQARAGSSLSRSEHGKKRAKVLKAGASALGVAPLLSTTRPSGQRQKSRKEN